MSFSQTATYAMRAMAWLAHQDLEQPRASAEIAAGTGIPEQYLSKILRRLVVADLLDSRKGRTGGFCLARAPGEITFGEILRAVDTMPELGLCVFGYGRCNASHPCALHQVWVKYLEHTEAWARSTTLDDVGALHEIDPQARRT